MAYKKLQGSTPSSILTLSDRKDISKSLYQLPASSEALAVEQVPPQVGHWIINEAIDALLEDSKKPLTNLFIKVFPNVELRQGLATEEIGFVLSEWISKTDYKKPGDALYYYVQDYVPIIRDVSEYEPVHLRAGWNKREFQYVSSYLDIEPYNKMLAKQARATSLAIARTLNIVCESIILGTNPAGFFDNGLLIYIWGKDKQPGDDNNYKSAKKFFDNTKNLVPFVKQAAGDFAHRLKNVIGITPYYSSLFPGGWEFKIEKPAKPSNNADEAALKTALKKRYTQETGANKDNPPAQLSRFICLYDACKHIEQIIQKMVSDESVENCMEYDPHATVQVTDKQFLCRANPSKLILIGNPADILEMQSGGSGYGPLGNLSFSLERVTSMGIEVYPLYGMLPGEFLILHKDCINLFQFYENTLDHFNVAELVEQQYTHYMFRPAIFSLLAGCKVIYNKWVPGSRDMNKLMTILGTA